MLFGEKHREGFRRFADHFADVDGRHGPFGAARFELGQIENLVDQSRQAHGLADDDAEEARALRQVDLGILVQHFGEGADRGQRRAQLVGHRGNEVVLHAIQFAQRMAGKRLLGAFAAEEAASQRQQVGDAGAAAPVGTGGGLRAADEQRGLARLAHVRHALQRDADVGPKVDQQAPHQAVRDLVEPGQAEQVLRPQQLDAEQAMGDESVRQPARLGERGQQQGVGP